MMAKLKINQTMPDDSIRTYEGELNLDLLKNLIGDQCAKITYGATQSDKAFGNGSETFISITVTCNQDQKTMDQVLSIVTNWVHTHISALHSEALAIWKQNNDLNKSILGANDKK